MWQHTSSCKASSQLIVLPSWMDFGSVSSVQPLPSNTLLVPLWVNRSQGKTHLLFFILGKKHTKQLGKKYGPCTSFCCGVIRHSPSIDSVDPVSSSYCYFVSSAQTLGIVSGLIRKQTVEFLFTGMRALVWASKESAQCWCGRACALLCEDVVPGGHMALWTLQQVNRARRASGAR